MKTLKIIMLLLICSLGLSAQKNQDAVDKTLSPYFMVTSNDASLEQMPLKSTSAQVTISGVIADVLVKQTYVNSGKTTIEAIYVFSASTRAAVYGMTMFVGNRMMVAKIREKEQARRDYEKAKKEGKTTSLLEQDRPNVFTMNVGNILPGDTISVELHYTELLIPEKGIYEFVYPTVVGPRYSNQQAASVPKDDQFVQNPYLHEGQQPNYTFDANITINAGMPLFEVACPSHKTNISFKDPESAIIKLDNSEKFSGNRDLVLHYKLKDNKIATGLLLNKGKDENYFLLIAQPPERFTPADIPPREYVFIMDVSGSMDGFPLEISKKLFQELVGVLRKPDKFNLVLFAGTGCVLSKEMLPATKSNIENAIAFFDKQKGGGGTRANAFKNSTRIHGTLD
jgi:Ca-activated chloride channel homolog